MVPNGTTARLVLLSKRALIAANIVLLLLAGPALAQTEQWSPLSGAETLRQFMSGLKAERTLPNGEVSRGEYRGDGTGTLYSWGATLPRTWAIKGDDQLCVTERRVTHCYSIESNMSTRSCTEFAMCLPVG